MAKQGTTKYYSEIQEQKIADFLGWSTVSGSGARPNHPGDVRTGDRGGFLVECKTHMKRHPVEFTKKIWNKIKEEALSQFKEPVYVTDDGSQWLKNTWVLCQMNEINGYEDHILFVDLPEKFVTKSGIVSFEGYELKKIEPENIDDKYLVWKVHFSDGDELALMTLSTFKTVIYRDF